MIQTEIVATSLRKNIVLGLAVWLLLTSSAAAQNTGTITGVVTAVVDDQALAKAAIQAKNSTTGATYAAESAADGRYTLTGLIWGTYEISVDMPGMRPFRKSGVAVESARTVQLDLRIEDWQLNTIGESREDIAAKRPTPPAGPMPRLSDGHPDFSGIWLGYEVIDPGKPEPLPWAAAYLKQELENNQKDWPELRCMPIGPILQGEDGDNLFVQTPKLISILYDIGHDLPRLIYMDGRPHPNDPNPSWMGHSIGKWDGDTLVVDTIGFNGREWASFEGLPTTERLHVVERFRRTDLGHLEKEIIVDDPGAYTKPWTIKKRTTLAPANYEFQEYVCNENNRDVEHSVGK